MKRNDVAAGLAEIASHIRGHLNEPLALTNLAERAGFSRYHFHRLFRSIMGEPIASYIRRERLQRAASALRDTDRDVTAIALAANYDSSSAFTRAFTQHFGVPPTLFRADDSLPIVPAHALPRFRLHEMEFRIETYAPLRMLGLRGTGNYRSNVPIAWEAVLRTARAHNLIESGTQFLVLSHDSPEYCEESELRFDVCISSGAEPVDDLRRIDRGGGQYAVYRHVGPYDLIEHIFDRLFDAIVFSGKHDLRDAPCMELYLNDPKITKQAELMTDVCIPIV